MEKIWETMLAAARGALRPREISPYVEAGGVAAAVESTSGRIYTGVCVDTACTLGICAERSALFHMLACGEDAVRRVVAVNSSGAAIPPCGACRELLSQLSPEHFREIEILLDSECGRVVTLGALTPEWWL